MKYGYDQATKCLFSWDGDFKYEGKHDVAPDDAFVVDEDTRPWTEMVACHFLSGHRRNCVYYLDAGENSISAYGNMLEADCKWTNCYPWEQVIKHIHPSAPVCVCGPIANDPAAIANLCKMYPCHTIYVCPLVEELAAFGILAIHIRDHEKPRRTSLTTANSHYLDGEHIEYDPRLDGDAYGRMADLIHHGHPVVNEIMSCPGISPFFGKLLSKKSAEPYTFLVRSEAMDRYFPTEPISAKVYAATSVPVEMTNTKAFMHASGCHTEKVNIVVASEHIPYLPAFLCFYKVMSNDDFVGTSCPKQKISRKSMPVFRYSRAYRVDMQEYERMYHVG